MRRGYKWVDRELAAMEPESDWERMISLYVGHRIPEFGLAMMIYPGTMRMMQSSMTAATLAHTSKLETRPHRRFQDGNDFLTAWMVDGLSSEAGRKAAARLNRIHRAVDHNTPHLPGNFDDVDDFVYPLVLLATFGDRLQTSLGLPGTSEAMKIAWHRWAQTLFRLLDRESGSLSDEAFPEDWNAMTEFAAKFDARPYEPTQAGHRVAVAMMDFFAERWFPAPLRAFGRDITRYLAGERVCRLHRIGWLSPRRERVVRLFLKSAFRAHRLLPDHRTPLPERLRRTRRTPAQLREVDRIAARRAREL
ncbi:oxygenase MpaB family protein [Streptomyces spinosisporus]|uniref:Oxygenase MpaB family protein n=1 Tax=Streptomyces spinosisporus TaxID=2927582 RepID=A0ABS9XHL3_9ACTN|nr:oxygenase MpaB family protein [Streptomyces spinosisporus]MCI3241579.1 oxygenase MpaB family protein [Streptomyces spinosisporus]